MYCVGIFADPGENPCVAVFLELSRKNVKKEYYVREMRQWRNTDESEIEKDIAAVHADSRYTVMRRVFSQDGRPARNVPTPPTLVMHFSGRDTAPIDRLRRRNVPVEGIAIREGGNWQRQDYRTICLGNNYFVSGADIQAAVSKVARENRLCIDRDLSPAAVIAESVNRIDRVSLFGMNAASPGGPALNPEQRNMLIALSLPIWFRETIRQIRRY